MSINVAALAALAATTAFAQSTATISGGINVGIVDTGAAGAKAAVTHLGNGANAININVAEDLGGGLRGGFESQIRFNSSNGDLNSSGAGGALFHSANTFVRGSLGTARIGSIVEAGTCAFDPWACTGGASLQAGLGVSALAGAGAIKQAVQYTTPTVNGFSANFTTSVSSRSNERQTLGVNYANGPLALTVVDIKGSANSAAATLAATTTAAGSPLVYTTTVGPTISDTATSQRGMAASYNLGVAVLSVTNTVSKAVGGATSSDITSIGATVPMGAYTLLAGYNKAKHIGTTNAANDTKLAVGANYALSKRTTLGADLIKVEAAGAGTGFVLRARHTF